MVSQILSDHSYLVNSTIIHSYQNQLSLISIQLNYQAYLFILTITHSYPTQLSLIYRFSTVVSIYRILLCLSEGVIDIF